MKVAISNKLKQLLAEQNESDVLQAILEAQHNVESKKPALQYVTRVSGKTVKVIQAADFELSSGDRISVGIADA